MITAKRWRLVIMAYWAWLVKQWRPHCNIITYTATLYILQTKDYQCPILYVLIRTSTYSTFTYYYVVCTTSEYKYLIYTIINNNRYAYKSYYLQVII